MSDIAPLSMKEASESIPLKRTSSIEAQLQSVGTCYAYTVTRLIVRMITQMMPQFFSISDDETDLLYSSDNYIYKSCFVEDNTNISEIISVLDLNKCPIPKRYNHMVIFYYTLYTIKEKYRGCGGIVSDIMFDFCRNFYFFYDMDKYYKIIISQKIDAHAKRILVKFAHFVINNNIQFELGYDSLIMNGQTETNNWITQFPENAKNALKKNMYVGFGYRLSYNQGYLTDPDSIYKDEKMIDTTCSKPIFGHIVTVTDWEPGYITIVNSAGTKWGNNGFIKIPAKYFYKFTILPSCESEEGSPFYHSFFYFDIINWAPPISTKVIKEAPVYVHNNTSMEPLKEEQIELPLPKEEKCSEGTCVVSGGKHKKKNKKTKRRKTRIKKTKRRKQK